MCYVWQVFKLVLSYLSHLRHKLCKYWCCINEEKKFHQEHVNSTVCGNHK